MFVGSHVVIILLTLFPCTLVVTYTLAVTAHHVKPLWPYISYTGNQPLESCFFSLAISICSALFILIVFLRYAQLNDAMKKAENNERYYQRTEKLNLISLLMGVGGAAGLAIVASFQQMNFHFAHLAGVLCCTYGTFAYFTLQTYLTYKIPLPPNHRSIKIIRLIAVIGIGLILACAPVLYIYTRVNHPHNVDWTTSNQHQDGVYIEGAILEWTLFFFNFLFTASFCVDLKKVSLTSGEIIFPG